MNYRIIFSAVLFILILTTPWWVYIPLLIIGTLYFSFFVEGILFAFIIDAAYRAPSGGFYSVHFPLAILIFILILVLVPLREHLRVHA